ncbi:TonB-dependent receptor [Herbaspirillum sp. YR522]|uniref:TonB-dependent siderophore receptor n=1 Tax=Herbaspirillum sp. YR522 TaxID=1144342 RepID=UPI00026FCDB4|nr:TonB-dependent receptor [Herbaspirillum sp. YR522]EJM97555.1 TonB-dependent siderophore receptor [Herbaspirillum sp. YR522]
MQPSPLQLRAAIIAVTVACAALCAPVALARQASITTAVAHEFQLDAGPLGGILMQIARQSGQAIAVDPELVRGRQARPVSGQLTAAQAVQQAIGEGELELQQTDNGTLTLKRRASPAAPTIDKLPQVTVAVERQPPPDAYADSYAVQHSSAATRIALSPRETPQSLTVITRARIDDFRLATLNDVFSSTAGVTVEKVETERTYYTARGFGITNFQFDGVGMPLTYSEQTGDLDTAMFDRIEIVRGANGLSSAAGNPSATVNFVRKRPTDTLQATTAASISSWNTRRVDADVSGPLNQAGTVAARMVLAHQEGQSYLQRYQPTKDLLYGVIEATLDAATVLTLGHSQQQVHGKGAMWGALPLAYADGSPTRYGVATSSSAQWSYYDSSEQRSFAELTRRLGRGWQWKTTFNYNQIKSDSALLYLAGSPDVATGAGLSVYPSLFAGANRQLFVDSNVTGKYRLGGRDHDLTAGVSWSRSRLDNGGRDTSAGYISIDGGTAFDGAFPYPVFDNSPTGSSYADRRRTAYAATRLDLDERLKLLLGANATRADSTGVAEGASHALGQSAVSPYVGLVLDLNRDLSLYGSHASIFNPQTEIDRDRATLAPARGTSAELGLKGEFMQGRANASAAVFRVQQNGIADVAGNFDDGQAYYRGIKARSEGVELDVTGELARNWQATLGLVIQRIAGDQGESARKYVPRRQLRLSSVVRLEQLEQMKIGASFNYQSQVRYNDSATMVQGGVWVANLMARYDIDKHLSVSANLNNVFNKKYLASVYWNQAYYAAPINGSVSIKWTY